MLAGIPAVLKPKLSYLLRVFLITLIGVSILLLLRSKFALVYPHLSWYQLWIKKGYPIQGKREIKGCFRGIERNCRHELSLFDLLCALFWNKLFIMTMERCQGWYTHVLFWGTFLDTSIWFVFRMRMNIAGECDLLYFSNWLNFLVCLPCCFAFAWISCPRSNLVHEVAHFISIRVAFVALFVNQITCAHSLDYHVLHTWTEDFVALESLWAFTQRRHRIQPR